MGLMGKWVPAHEHFTLLLRLIVIFVFGGRSGSKRLGDFWVLDTDIWQWYELTSFGDLPSPRDFAETS